MGPTSEKEIDELVKKEQEKAWGTVGTMIAIVLGYLALILFLGFCYSKLWADPLVLVEKPLEAEAFAHGAFGCLEDEHRAISSISRPFRHVSTGFKWIGQDIHACALGFCCTPFRWADTMKAAGVMGFWTGLLVFLTVSNLRILAQDSQFRALSGLNDLQKRPSELFRSPERPFAACFRTTTSISASS